MADVICGPCQAGRHPHDRWGPNAPEVQRGEYRAGDDAGCPNLVGPWADQRECECRHVNPSRARASHPHCPTCRCGRG